MRERRSSARSWPPSRLERRPRIWAETWEHKQPVRRFCGVWRPFAVDRWPLADRVDLGQRPTANSQQGEKVKKLIIAILALTAAVATADEGMWMPQQVPQLKNELQKMGIKIDPQRFADLT